MTSAGSDESGLSLVVFHLARVSVAFHAAELFQVDAAAPDEAATDFAALIDEPTCEDASARVLCVRVDGTQARVRLRAASSLTTVGHEQVLALPELVRARSSRDLFSAVVFRQQQRPVLLVDAPALTQAVNS